MIEELQAILDVLGDITGIAGWVIGGWLAFKAIILLSTTGSIVYISALAINKFSSYLTNCNTTKIEQAEINKRTTLVDVELRGMCITKDGTYESVVDSIKKVRRHVDTVGGSYIHTEGANWLADAVAEKIERDIKIKGKK